MNYLRFGNKSKSGINVKIENFNAMDIGPFPSTVGGARGLAQRRKLIGRSEFQSKEYIVSRTCQDVS